MAFCQENSQVHLKLNVVLRVFCSRLPYKIYTRHARTVPDQCYHVPSFRLYKNNVYENGSSHECDLLLKRDIQTSNKRLQQNMLGKYTQNTIRFKQINTLLCATWFHMYKTASEHLEVLMCVRKNLLAPRRIENYDSSAEKVVTSPPMF